MKKLLSVLLAAVLVTVSLTVSVFAEGFAPSITVKPAPDVETTPDPDGKPVIGHVVDENGNILSTEYHDCIVITPVSEAKTSERIPADAAELLLDVYDEISAEGYKFSSMSEKLNGMVAADLGEGKDADDLVVRDLFDVTVLCEELETLLAVEGNVITIKFKVAVDKSTPVYVMTYTDGVWEPIVKTVNNGDGTLSCTFEHFCPVVFMVPADNAPDTPPTGDTSVDNTLWVTLMIGASLLVIALVAANVHYYRRRKFN